MILQAEGALGMKLKGKVAIVTGGTRGIGAALVKKLAADGAAVAFSYVSSADAAAAVERAVRDAGGRAVAVKADVRDRAAVDALVAKAAEWGGVDIAVNNAHQAYDGKMFEQASWDDFQREFDTIIKGPVNVIQACLPHFKQRGGGVVVNVGSTMSIAPREQHSFYVAAKCALNGLTESLAVELGPLGIRVNTLTPGPLATDHNASYPKEVMGMLAQFTPLKNRLATVEEVAASIALLTYDEAACVTGANVLASGGLGIS